VDRYPLYDDMVREFDGPRAIILHRQDSQLPLLLQQPLAANYERTLIGEYVVLIPKAGGEREAGK